MKMYFPNFQLIINGEEPSLDNFTLLLNEKDYDSKEFFYKFDTSFHNERFFWLYAEYVSPFN
jgi:hypothetical protein